MMSQQSCSYNLLSNGIHKFVFNESNRRAVDQHVAVLRDLYRYSPSESILTVLVDLRPSGWPPMSYTMNSLRQLNAEFPNAPKQRYAFLYSQGALFSVAQSFFGMINRNVNTPVHFFKGDLETDAVAWLLKTSEDVKVTHAV